jgi:hypothetical protein
MTINMTCSPPKSLKQVTTFLQVSDCNYSVKDKKERNKFIRTTTWNLKYRKMRKKDKGLVIRYISLIFNLSHIQSKRLLKLASRGMLKDPKSRKNVTSFKKKYTSSDVALLAEFDDASNYPNGFALQVNLKRMLNVFGDIRFENLANISHGHIYNIRKSSQYEKFTLVYQKTKPVFNNEIGVREKPNPLGPGYLRVDSVHGGDLDEKKGVYYINLVDELTQNEATVCVEGISERYLTDIWEDILDSFPFVIRQFHSDNGSEFINRIVAKLLNKLNIRQSKSRPRHSNDNGLVETKNGWVIRKHFGYSYVESYKAPIINKFLQDYFNEYLNYHRVCAFPTKTVLPNGKVKTIYKKEDYKTPYDRLKEIDPKGESLKSGTSYEILDKIAYSITDYDCVIRMKKAYQSLVKELKSSSS